MSRSKLFLFLLVGTLLIGSTSLGAMSLPESDDARQTSAMASISIKDNYMDLNTGKIFRISYDELNETYGREDLLAFDLYVNTRTKDTFWLEEAVLVNNALKRDAGGNYRVDPMKVKRDGNGYKVINNKADRKPTDVDNGNVQKEAGASAM